MDSAPAHMARPYGLMCIAGSATERVRLTCPSLCLSRDTLLWARATALPPGQLIPAQDMQNHAPRAESGTPVTTERQVSAGHCSKTPGLGLHPLGSKSTRFQATDKNKEAHSPAGTAGQTPGEVTKDALPTRLLQPVSWGHSDSTQTAFQ